MSKAYIYLSNLWEEKLIERKRLSEKRLNGKEDNMNLNKLAREITLQEGLKTQVNIGNVKEILRLMFTNYDILDVIKIWIKYNKK